ncbi:4-hydroxythreonine-4-phosphate dehydrogenase PdxA [Amaricoccus solimangrovi]|uniref:4-hydroxythreonine-4-phosphate dehydrogenase n=1 Tax=Amaricoccus solimangrovi TaxID=2589815 RepID=A0A501WWZ5_9RHOB|nr:4-hydroxythreonine-4-phosphate dehydrogenase PdxA [Amaricoccus solimangrovi]TPE52960.1 4-hydroxythreonine-4-phosphate dehydrogenase PdxA [Amaricoccus solimangrovi]
MIPPIALTQGDPAGIGPEIALKAWTRLAGEVAFFVLGDADHMTEVGRGLGVPVRPIADPAEAGARMAEGLPVLPHPMPRPTPPGRPDPANAPAVVEIIARAVALARSGAALAVCTNPINKKALQDGAGFAFPGHTEFLASLCGAPLPVMMLAAPALRVVPVTIHIPIAEVPRALTADLLERTLRVTWDGLRRDFGVARPRIAVAGLNPHAGEGGAMGREEIALITPVLDRLRAEGMDLSGPRSADTLFHAAARANYDVAVCMYHDQALIPLKTLDFDGGVNVTLGLDFVRSSPDHGTAYDIAGQNRANPSSLIAALRLAREMGLARARAA